MRIYEEKNLPTFEFWGPAENNALRLTWAEMEQIEDVLSELYPDGIEATNLNDLFAYDFESVCEWIGLDAEEVYNREEESAND